MSLYCITIEDTAPLVYVKDLSLNGTLIFPSADPTATHLLKSKDASWLLQNGDVIRIGGTIAFQFEYDVNQRHLSNVPRSRRQLEEMKVSLIHVELALATLRAPVVFQSLL